MLKILFVLIITIQIFPQQSKLSKAVNYLSGFIASDYFLELEKTTSQLKDIGSNMKRRAPVA